jgi:hypothetical protein
VIVIGKAKGCGFYLFGAFLGCVYQLIISPLRWADSTAQHMAKRVELGLQKEILSAYGGVNPEDIRDIGAPFLAIG